MTKTILAIDTVVSNQVKLLDDHFDVIRLWKEKNPERLLQERGAEISAVTSSLLPVRRSLIEALPNLEIISNCAVGYDNIDLEACKERGILVTNTPDVLTNDTADTALLLMLGVMRRGVEGDAYLRAGLWKKHGAAPLGSCLSGKTAGIIGLGRIGQAIAHRIEAFDMKVVYQGPRKKTDFAYTYYEDLEKMASEVDVLVAACPGGEATKGIVNDKILKALGEQGFFINIARGSVVQQGDLILALANKHIAGAGLDVYWKEPDVPQELLTMDNVVLTPHIGSATNETRNKMGQIVLGNLLAHFDGQPLLTEVKL